MKITPILTNSIIKKEPLFGKHKIPRFIYHMTNKRAYESMLKDGVLKAKRDDLLGNAVFATDLPNFFKRWGTNNNWENKSLHQALINQISHEYQDIVILKISTSALNHDLLKIRSQNKLLSWFVKEGNSLFDKVSDITDALPKPHKNWNQKAFQILQDLLKDSGEKEFITHITKGEPAKFAKLFKRRKEAIEYAYLADIPMEKVTKIGDLNIVKIKQTPNYDKTKPIKSMFIELLKGTPEVKGAELLKC